MRGRGGNNNNNNNNNRKGPNPLTRSYESNGPDVKIRGTAQPVAEKYTTLARDAQSSGDRVMAENYLQHAEHYNRIIAAAMAQQQQFQQQQRDSQDDFDDDGEDDRPERDQRGGDYHHQPQQQHSQQVNGFGPQPVIEGMPAEPAYQAPAAAEQTRAEDGEPEAQAVNGNGHARQAEGEDGAPRRGRRPRRARNRADQAGEEGGAPEGEQAADGFRSSFMEGVGHCPAPLFSRPP